MFMAKYLLIALGMLPVAELAVFIAVASQIGFGRALLLVIASSALGALVLRRAGGSHIERARMALGPQRISALQADATGLIVLLAGFLLLVPGFITSLAGLVLLIAPLRRRIATALRRSVERTQRSGIVDLEPDDWQQVEDPKLTDRRPPR
jgi:UPF0716 protein FxsA